MPLLTLSSCIQLIAPSSRDLDDFNNDLNFNFLNKIVVSLIKPFTIYGEDLFYANTNYQRAKNVKEALVGEADIIWCIKGGKGTTQVIPYLEGKVKDFSKLNIQDVSCKIFVGYSDATALHLFLHKNFPSLPTLHASNWHEIINAKCNEETLNTLEKIFLHTPEVIYPLKLLSPIGPAEPINTFLTGGNLTLIELSIGTGWQIEAANKILILEDVNLEDYQIERAFEHLLQAHILDNVKAIILCEFTDINEEKMSLIQTRFMQRLVALNNSMFPGVNYIYVFKANIIGHSAHNLPVFLNAPASLERCEIKGYYLRNWIPKNFNNI